MTELDFQSHHTNHTVYIVLKKKYIKHTRMKENMIKTHEKKNLMEYILEEA